MIFKRIIEKLRRRKGDDGEGGRRKEAFLKQLARGRQWEVARARHTELETKAFRLSRRLISEASCGPAGAVLSIVERTRTNTINRDATLNYSTLPQYGCHGTRLPRIARGRAAGRPD